MEKWTDFVHLINWCNHNTIFPPMAWLFCLLCKLHNRQSLYSQTKVVQKKGNRDKVQMLSARQRKNSRQVNNYDWLRKHGLTSPLSDDVRCGSLEIRYDLDTGSTTHNRPRLTAAWNASSGDWVLIVKMSKFTISLNSVVLCERNTSVVTNNCWWKSDYYSHSPCQQMRYPSLLSLSIVVPPQYPCFL